MISPVITCKFTSLLDFSRTYAELPLNALSFSKVLNGSGSWAGTLNVEDPKIRETAWLESTGVNKSALWIDVDGALLYGGRTTGRPYTDATGSVPLSGSDFPGYFSQRNQGFDYEVYTDPEGHAWSTTGAPALNIAYWILKHALEKAYSIPVKVVATGSVAAAEYWITFSAPGAQTQTLASLLSQLQELGYMTGIDYAQDVAYVNEIPTATVTLAYPRRGVGRPVFRIDLSNALDFEWPEDGTSQADSIVETAGATEVRSSDGIWLPARAAGYPLLEASLSHSALAPSGKPGAALSAYVAGDLTTLAYPLTVPVVTLPMFGSPSVSDLEVGDDIEVYVPVGAGDLPLNNPRFPEGLEVVMRITRIDCEIPDEGVPVMHLTLNAVPSLTPVEPPEETSEARKAREAKEHEEAEAREKEQTEKEEKEAEEAKAKAEKEAEEAEAIAKEAEEKAKEAQEAAEAAQKVAEEAGEAARAARLLKEAEAAARLKELAEEAKRKAKEAKEEKKRRLSEAAKRRAEKRREEAERAKEKGEEVAEVHTTKVSSEEAKKEAEKAKEEGKGPKLVYRTPSGPAERITFKAYEFTEDSLVLISIPEIEFPGENEFFVHLINPAKENNLVAGKLSSAQETFSATFTDESKLYNQQNNVMVAVPAGWSLKVILGSESAPTEEERKYFINYWTF